MVLRREGHGRLSEALRLVWGASAPVWWLVVSEIPRRASRMHVFLGGWVCAPVGFGRLGRSTCIWGRHASGVLVLGGVRGIW